VYSGALRHMTCGKKIFTKFQEQERGMNMELSDDATYPMKGLASISFLMPSNDIIKLK
jgi:hypothetical protein